MGLWIQNFKQALRGLRHQGWQAVVSVVGLAVSIVCLTFSVNWLWTETHYDSFRPDYEGLYVLERGDTLWRSPYVWYDLGVELDSVLGENVSVGIYRPQRGRELFCLPDRPETAFYAQGLAASTDMVTTFGCRVLSGCLLYTSPLRFARRCGGSEQSVYPYRKHGSQVVRAYRCGR